MVEAKLTKGQKEIILGKKSRFSNRFNESTVRTVGRNSIGVKGVTMSKPNDEVIGMICLEPDSENTILVVSENGYENVRTLIIQKMENQFIVSQNVEEKGVKLFLLRKKLEI